MRKNSAAHRLGLTCIALCLLLRFHGTLEAVLAAPETGEFLLYLETGRRAVRSEQTKAAVPAYAPESPAVAGALTPEALPLPAIVTAPTEAPEPPPPVFTAQDGADIQLYNTAGVDLDPETAILQAPAWPEVDGPKVLIYSSHATESYQKNGENYTETAAYRTLDSGFNMLSLGAALEAALEAQGIPVLRDEALHDYPSYNDSYISSRKSAQAYLDEYPSLCLVLDLHRDASSGKQQLRPLVQMAGGAAAKIMLVVGTDRGNRIHPNWQKNFSLALRLQTLLERASPGITRPINIRSQRFNQDLSPGALLIEIGGAGNTHQEALASTDILAQAIEALLQ